MSNESQRIDPLGVCVHAVVERQWTDLGEATEEWRCVTCKARFYHLDFSKHQGKIQVMEPHATLRDQFAMAALTGVVLALKEDILKGIPDGSIAKATYALADDMMKERNQ